MVGIDRLETSTAFAGQAKSRPRGRGDAREIGAPSDVHRLMTSDPGEVELTLEGSSIEGELPADLIGGLYAVNGPSRLVFGGRLAHPFDGHGLLRAFRLEGKARARFSTRYVRTKAFERENAAQRLLYAGLGTAVAPRDLKLRHILANLLAHRTKNVANTSVYAWAGRLLCGWEGGVPHAVRLSDLQTEGPFTFGGALEGARCLAHTRVDHAQARLVTTSVVMGRNTTLTMREIDRDGRAISTTTAERRGTMLVHDFAITRHHYVLLANPLQIDLRKMAIAAAGFGPFIESVSTDRTATSEILLIPRRPGRVEPLRIPLGAPSFAVHYANAFDTDGGRIVLDAVVFHDLELGHELGFVSSEAPLAPERQRPLDGRLVRFTLDLATGRVEEEATKTTRLDLPRVHPARDGLSCRYVYAAASRRAPSNGIFDAIVRVDMDAREGGEASWVSPPGYFAGEPLFVPRSGARDEGDGWVLAMVSSVEASESALGIFDARSLARGPVARLSIPFPIPFAFHGCFVPPAAAGTRRDSAA